MNSLTGGCGNVSDGLVDETRGLLARYGPVKALDSLGYRQGLAVLAGTLSVETGVMAAQQGHRNYAKRQLIWFRREPEVHWLEGFGDEARILYAAAELVDAKLEEKLKTTADPSAPLRYAQDDSFVAI